MITIHPSRRIDEGARTKLLADIDFSGTRRQLWYSVEQQYADALLPGRNDSFLVAMLPFAMQLREDLRVEGVVSERLFYNLSRGMVRILSLMYPHLHPIEIVPAHLDRTVLHDGPGGVATGLSGGIDSFCVFADHFSEKTLPGYRITHCLFHNVGSHGHDAKARDLFRQRYERLLPLAKEWNIPFVTVDTNLHELVQDLNLHPAAQFVKTHTLRNASCALVLQKLLGKYFYASAFPYESCRIGPADAMGYSDPYAVHLLSTESTECISTGCQYTRVQKTERVTEIPASYRYLDVCCRKVTKGNCSVCKKCARTLLTLDILGKLELYGEVFDLVKYRHIRNRQMVKALCTRDPFFDEIRELAEQRGFEFPSTVRWAAKLRLTHFFPGKSSLKK